MKDIKCSPEAREKCPFDLRCASEEEAYFEEGSACDGFNKKLNPPPPPTNADHIRSMADEELADFMSEHAIEDFCYIVCGGECKALATLNKTSGQVCREIVSNWLKQPYKEEP